MSTKRLAVDGGKDKAAASRANSSRTEKKKQLQKEKSKDESKRNVRSSEAGSVIIRDPNGEDVKLDRGSRSSTLGSDSGSKSALKKKGKGADSKPNMYKKKPGRTKARKRTLTEKVLLAMGFHVGAVALKDPRAVEAAQALNLKPWHLRRLKTKFDKVDLDGSGNIDYEEFFEAVGEQRSPFTDKLFALIDLDGSGTIEFDEFVRVLATYCMFTKDEILRFCFECFDIDHSGTIDEKEFIELCKCINNASPSFPNNFKRALEEFDVNEDGLIDYAEFLEIDRRYPLVLFPAFRLQDMMQRNSLGENTWVKVIEAYQESRRIEEYKAAHGGRAPPEPALTACLKAVLPCLFVEKVHIRVGADMEARHRGAHDEY